MLELFYTEEILIEFSASKASVSLVVYYGHVHKNQRGFSNSTLAQHSVDPPTSEYDHNQILSDTGKTLKSGTKG